MFTSLVKREDIRDDTLPAHEVRILSKRYHNGRLRSILFWYLEVVNSLAQSYVLRNSIASYKYDELLTKTSRDHVWGFLFEPPELVSRTDVRFVSVAVELDNHRVISINWNLFF